MEKLFALVIIIGIIYFIFIVLLIIPRLFDNDVKYCDKHDINFNELQELNITFSLFNDSLNEPFLSLFNFIGLHKRLNFIGKILFIPIYILLIYEYIIAYVFKYTVITFSYLTNIITIMFRYVAFKKRMERLNEI